MYKFQVVAWNEHPVDDEARLTADTLSIAWNIKVVESAEYEGRKKKYFTTYWASEAKIQRSYENALAKFIQDNPGASMEDAQKAREPWRPQEALYAFLHSVGLMDIVDDKYVPLGWELSDPVPALNAAIGRTFIGKVGPDRDDPTKYPDNVFATYPVNEQ